MGAARPLPDDRVTAQGVGLIDLGGATATEVGASPASLALGRAGRPKLAHRPGIRSAQRLVPSPDPFARRTRRREGSGGARVRSAGRSISRSGREDRSVIHVRAHVTSKLVGTAPAEGVVIVTPAAGREIRVPWTITFGKRRPPGLASVRLSTRTFSPSDAAPALLSFVAGSVRRSAGEPDVFRCPAWISSCGARTAAGSDCSRACATCYRVVIRSA